MTNTHSKLPAPMISFEGVDCSGKTTAIAYLQELLKEKGYQVIRSREPGGTPLGEELRTMLLTKPMCAKTEILLFAAIRAEHMNQLIFPALANGNVVLCDRFIDSTYAYQGRGRGETENTLWAENFVLEGFEPTFTLFFDIELEESLKRLSFRETKDRFEIERQEFHQRVFNGYRERFQDNPHRMVRIDAMQTIENVQEQIKNWVETVFVVSYPLPSS